MISCYCKNLQLLAIEDSLVGGSILARCLSLVILHGVIAQYPCTVFLHSNGDWNRALHSIFVKYPGTVSLVSYFAQCYSSASLPSTWALNLAVVPLHASVK